MKNLKFLFFFSLIIVGVIALFVSLSMYYVFENDLSVNLYLYFIFIKIISLVIIIGYVGAISSVKSFNRLLFKKQLRKFLIIIFSIVLFMASLLWIIFLFSTDRSFVFTPIVSIFAIIFMLLSSVVIYNEIKMFI